MAVRNPPLWQQNRTDHTAENDRLGVGAFLALSDNATLTGRASGVMNQPYLATGAGPLAVVQHSTPNMSVDVNTGICYVDGSEAVTQGGYWVTNDSLFNIVISASSPTLNRIDLIIVRVVDQVYSGSSNQATIEVVTGTPASSPVAFSLPSGSCFILAQIAIAANASSIVSANITDRRVYQGAMLPTWASTARPTNMFTGLVGVEYDVGNIAAYLAGGMKVIYDGGAWTNFTPTFKAGGVTTGTSNFTLEGKYRMLDAKTCAVYMALLCQASFTGGTGMWSLALPFMPSSSTSQVLSGRCSPTSGHHYSCWGFVTSGTQDLAIYASQNNASPIQARIQSSATAVPEAWTSTGVVSLSGIYEIA